jgi:transcriptional regulator with XRE-family HTH domain
MRVPISNNFARLLEEKQRRENRYIPLSEVAQATGITRRTLYKWQNNTVTRYDPNVIDALCEYFKVSLTELLNHTLPAESPKPPAKTKK